MDESQLKAIEEAAREQVKIILGDIMRQVRECDERLDDDGFCSCSRNIAYWLFLFKRNELLAYKVGQQKALMT
jgi:hypothetical protein